MSTELRHYPTLYARSIHDRERFWADESMRIDWHKPPEKTLDFSKPPFARWFVGGMTNLCHNAIDRWLPTRADQPALIWYSSEVEKQCSISYRTLHQQVNTCSAMLQSLGVVRGARVLIYMPMIPEAVVVMLACVRLGAIHSVVFGGFAAHALATRIDDASPHLIVATDGGIRAGKINPYKPLLDEALSLSQHTPAHVLMFNRGLVRISLVAGRDVDWNDLYAKYEGQQVPCVWLESSEPSYILYTSGTTGRPKGVQRDTGGYAVALTSSMDYIFDAKAGETFFCTSDIGWVVGHSYIVYAPLLAGMTTILYEGTPLRPDAGILWKIAHDYQVNVLFSSPTAIRVLKKQDPAWLKKYPLPHLRSLFLAGEPLDEHTSSWISEGLGKPIVDNYWQTESGWPILSYPMGVEAMSRRLGSPGVPMCGYDVRLLHETTGEPVPVGEKGVLGIVPPLPPGCLSTVWQDDERFLRTYFESIPQVNGQAVYSSFDWGICDKDGYYFILGRTDDVINTAGHRLGTREIEEAICSHKAIAECAVIGIADNLKGQVPVGFAVVRDPGILSSSSDCERLEGEVMSAVVHYLGAIARPLRVYFVTNLPKTRSGKVLRRSLQALCENRDLGDLSTIEDGSILDEIKQSIKGLVASG